MSRVLVVGGGITGLSAAWEVAGAGGGVTVVESQSSFGGKVRTERVGGYLIEHGPGLVHHLQARCPGAGPGAGPGRSGHRRQRAALCRPAGLRAHAPDARGNGPGPAHTARTLRPDPDPELAAEDACRCRRRAPEGPHQSGHVHRRAAPAATWRRGRGAIRRPPARRDLRGPSGRPQRRRRPPLAAHERGRAPQPGPREPRAGEGRTSTGRPGRIALPHPRRGDGQPGRRARGIARGARGGPALGHIGPGAAPGADGDRRRAVVGSVRDSRLRDPGLRGRGRRAPRGTVRRRRGSRTGRRATGVHHVGQPGVRRLSLPGAAPRARLPRGGTGRRPDQWRDHQLEQVGGPGPSRARS